jgi:hypothetical protein
MLAMFLDESGDHSLDVIDPQYPLFVLGGCIIDMDYHEDVLVPRLKKYKMDLFDRDDFILHTADIVRRRGVFHKLTDKAFRDHFYNETNLLMDELEYMVIACAIKKNEHIAQYGLAALDPYMLSLRVLIERFVLEIQQRGGGSQGLIIAEARDETLDNELRLAWMELRTSGTGFISASDVRRHISELRIRDKKKGVAGLQIADLVVSPIGRHILGKNPKQDWNVIQKKFRRNMQGRYMGYGLVILPKNKQK